MAIANGSSPVLDGAWFKEVNLTSDDSGSSLNSIPPRVFNVTVDGYTNDVNDFIVLPSLADVPCGHEITILCNAGTFFELRTPASSNEKINNVDADGSQEYLCTDTRTVKITKVSNTDGWMAREFTITGTMSTHAPD